MSSASVSLHVQKAIHGMWRSRRVSRQSTYITCAPEFPGTSSQFEYRVTKSENRWTWHGSLVVVVMASRTSWLQDFDWSLSGRDEIPPPPPPLPEETLCKGIEGDQTNFRRIEFYSSDRRDLHGCAFSWFNLFPCIIIESNRVGEDQNWISSNSYAPGCSLTLIGWKKVRKHSFFASWHFKRIVD